MSSKVHVVAQAGFGIGNELYDRYANAAPREAAAADLPSIPSARPSYQPNALAHIRQSIKAAGPLNVVEYVYHAPPFRD